MPTFLFNVYCFETACTYLIDLYEGILTRWQRGTANIGIKIPFCWPFAVPYWKTRNFYCFRQTKDQLNLKWKLSDNIIEYYGHLIVFFCMLFLYIAHDRQLTTRCKIVWSGKRTEHFHCWLLSQTIFYTTHTHTHIYIWCDTCAHTHKIHTKAWMVGRLLSFIFFCVFCYIFSSSTSLKWWTRKKNVPLPLQTNELNRNTRWLYSCCVVTF